MDHGTKPALVNGLQGLLQHGRRLTLRPFTITDAHSRYLTIAKRSYAWTETRSQRSANAMREYRMPIRIRTDNGTPFVGSGLLGLSKLSISWIKLGIVHERIQPADRSKTAATNACTGHSRKTRPDHLH